MKRSKLVVIYLLIFAMLTVMVSGCGNKKTESENKQPESQNASAPHEVYTIENRVAFSGLENPHWADRSQINKALPKEKKDKIVIGWTALTMGSPFFVELIESAKAKAVEYGYELNVSVADFSLEKQSAQIDAFISQGVDIIVDNAIDVKAGAVDVKRAIAAGIPVIGFGPPFAADVPAITSVGQNLYFSGWESGLVVGERFKDKPIKSAVILGQMGHQIAESRINGVIAGIIYKRYEQMGKPFASKEDAMLKGYQLFDQLRKNGTFKDADTNFEVVSTQQGGWMIEGGLKAMEDILAAHSDINLLLSENDLMGIGAIKAIEQRGLVLGKDIEIASEGDGYKEALEMIKQDKFLVSGYFNPNHSGEIIIDLIHKIFSEGYDANNMPHVTSLPLVPFTKNNVDQYYDPNLKFTKFAPFEFKTIDQLNQK